MPPAPAAVGYLEGYRYAACSLPDVVADLLRVAVGDFSHGGVVEDYLRLKG